MSIAQKVIRAKYLWSTLFNHCIHAIKRCTKCHVYIHKACSLPTPLHPVIVGNPFFKWGIEFMTCNCPSRNGHKYINTKVNYFTKWAESMPTFNNMADTTAHLFFNHVISCFGVPLQLVSHHEIFFENELFPKLSSHL